MKLPTLPADKANHFVYGAVIAALGLMVHSPEAGAMACLIFAVGKEAADRISGAGNPELADALATVAGGAAVLLPALAPRLVGVAS
jgi:hypothetical protein